MAKEKKKKKDWFDCAIAMVSFTFFYIQGVPKTIHIKKENHKNQVWECGLRCKTLSKSGIYCEK